MPNEIEKLPRLIERAAAALSRATNAGEVLEAKTAAGVAYDTAKIAARLVKAKDAHDKIIETIRKTQADALIIETRAQCRLADEYDAAQERGEVQGHGGDHTSKIPNQNLASTLTNIGLTSKEVHQARKVRDAEKQKPGVVRKMLDKQLEDGEEPTRADVKRVVSETVAPKKKKSKGTAAQRKARNERIITLADAGVKPNVIASEVGLVARNVHQILEHEKIRREARAEPEITNANLSMSAQEKLAAALRQRTRTLEAEFERRVREEIKQRIDDLVLPHWKAQIAEAKAIYARRKAWMDKETFNVIRRALHPDSRKSISDKKLEEAFNTFMKLEKFLLNEKDSPTVFGDLPANMAEWDKMRAKNSRPKSHATFRPMARR